MQAEQPFGRPSPARADSVRTVSGTGAADSVRTVPWTRVRGVSLDRADTPIRGVSDSSVRTAATPLDGICLTDAGPNPRVDAGMNGPASTDPRDLGSAARRPVKPDIAPRMQPSDRLVRVLAEGLRSIAERGAREKTERRNRAIIVLRIDGDER